MLFKPQSKKFLLRVRIAVKNGVGEGGGEGKGVGVGVLNFFRERSSGEIPKNKS